MIKVVEMTTLDWPPANASSTWLACAVSVCRS